MSKFDKIITVILILFVILDIYLTFKKGDIEPVKAPVYKTICLEGKAYWSAPGMIAVQLDNVGCPVYCAEEVRQ